MEIRQIPVKDLHEWERNPRKHDVDRLVKSIEAFGFRAPLVVNETPKGYVVEAGHGRLKAAIKLGMKTLPCVVVKDDERTAAAFSVADNRQVELTTWDMPALKDILQDMLDLGDISMEAVGYTEQELESLMTQFHVPGEGLTDDDAVPDEAPPICKTGDLWLLGDHRLLCGDSTKAEDVARLMDGKKAQLCLTDPPYGLGWDYKTTDDTEANLKSLVSRFMPLAQSVSDVVFVTPGNKHLSLYPSADWILCWFIPAGTGVGPWGFVCWHPVLAYGKDPYLKHGKGSRPDGLALTESSPDVKHPCPKPVGVWSWFVERGSVSAGDIVLDLFLGSGTTLIACEKLGRKCYGMEIDEKYCDVIVKRWEDYTGKKAEKI